jgi:hypothetical protein
MTYKNTENLWVIIPKIIGEIPLEKLDDNEDYFISLISCIKKTVDRGDGINRLYHNSKLKHLDTTRVSIMTNQLKQQSETLKCFVQQAENNCFMKSHEPGFVIRSNDSDVCQQIIGFQLIYAAKLSIKDIVNKRNELEQALCKYWQKETFITGVNYQQLLKTITYLRKSEFLNDSGI